MEQVELYHTPLGPEADVLMDQAFTRLAESHDENPTLHIEAREIHARRKAGGVVWFDFKTLCGGPRSMNDYLELATQFHTLMLSNVPQMAPRLASEAGAQVDQRARAAVEPLPDLPGQLPLPAS